MYEENGPSELPQLSTWKRKKGGNNIKERSGEFIIAKIGVITILNLKYFKGRSVNGKNSILFVCPRLWLSRRILQHQWE